MGDYTLVGSEADGERPAHPVRVNGFSIDATAVTNAQFARFVEATGYVTTAQRYQSSSVFYSQLAAFDTPSPECQPEPLEPSPIPWWWKVVEGAYWSAPFGPGSTVADRQGHPVVHVSHEDALAYCGWAGRALPTEAQWECASRGDLKGEPYPWGSDRPRESEPLKANTFHGVFPYAPTRPVGTIAVDALPPNDIGMYQTVGNVWEWTADAYVPGLYETRAALPLIQHLRRPVLNPHDAPGSSEYMLRGGSFLCHESYCDRYRNSARIHAAPTTSASHTGFRTVARNIT